MSDRTPVTPERPVWVTKYALGGGIQRHDDGLIVADGTAPYFRLHKFGGYFILGRDAFVSEAEARADVVRRAEAKIKSIEKQAAKLRALIASNGGEVSS
ncbi:MAG TPA: hypothetical protein VM221_02825 [Armatimonadota bacterium]|nr:hypothetical protein [Armatimonadota bacterium]